MREWLENTIKDLVQFPEQVSLSQTEGVVTVVWTAKVAASDLKPFEGSHSRLTRALSRAASLAGAKSRKRHILKVQA